MKSQTAPPPFALQYSSQIPELLHRLNSSLALSTFQAGKLIFLSPKDENTLIQLPRNFQKPMGFSFDESYSRLALACKEEIIVFRSSTELAAHYPKSPATYDTLYMPRATYHSGGLDVHDLHFGKENKLYGVNTLFSCISLFDDNYNFTPVWSPPQITELASEDRCHLNGMAMQDGLPKYATAFNQGNTVQSWRENITSSGVIFDVESSEVIAQGLAMPHSPKIYNNQLYVLQSAKGEVSRVDVYTGRVEVVAKIGGFVRGMTLIGDYLFVARSKLRKNSSTFAHLNIPESENNAGIFVLHLPSGSLAGQIIYQSSVDEIYDLHALKGCIRPNILNTISTDYKNGLSTPNATYWAQTQENHE